MKRIAAAELLALSLLACVQAAAIPLPRADDDRPLPGTPDPRRPVVDSDAQKPPVRPAPPSAPPPGHEDGGGRWVLRGADGPIQVTLTWTADMQDGKRRAREDLDLHLIDPENCRVYYGHRECGPARLDLDHNAACQMTDHASGAGNDTENIIFHPTLAPKSGSYDVWVVDYQDGCSDGAPSVIRWKVTVRVNGQSREYTGSFPQGSRGDSFKAASFTYPR